MSFSLLFFFPFQIILSQSEGMLWVIVLLHKSEVYEILIWSLKDYSFFFVFFKNPFDIQVFGPLFLLLICSHSFQILLPSRAFCQPIKRHLPKSSLPAFTGGVSSLLLFDWWATDGPAMPGTTFSDKLHSNSIRQHSSSTGLCPQTASYWESEQTSETLGVLSLFTVSAPLRHTETLGWLVVPWNQLP